jgi:outer membrane protein insertion porin family
VNLLNSEFPQAGFDKGVKIASETEKIRSSTGLELQVMLPVVNAPFRLYWAYNPTIVNQFIQKPIAADRSMFPNQATFQNAIQSYGLPFAWPEKRKVFRFTIGRTF